MNIRKEARHQSGGDQQRQGNKTLMHQEYIRFFARTIADDATQGTKGIKPLVFCYVPVTLARAHEDSRAATQQGRARAQDKVLDYGLRHFQEASVPVYGWPKRQHPEGNRFNTKGDTQPCRFTQSSGSRISANYSSDEIG